MSARRKPDLATIGGRLKAERERLGLSQAAFAVAGGGGRRVLCNWETGATAPNAVTLQALARAGADILYIVTGERAVPATPIAGVTVRQALAMLDPADRHRLLLDLLADELRG